MFDDLGNILVEYREEIPIFTARPKIGCEDVGPREKFVCVGGHGRASKPLRTIKIEHFLTCIEI
jgi:hypothetical protein